MTIDGKYAVGSWKSEVRSQESGVGTSIQFYSKVVKSLSDHRREARGGKLEVGSQETGNKTQELSIGYGQHLIIKSCTHYIIESMMGD
ncbi:MAG: hypothetical protein AAFP76_17745 [Bacteroidota bacterium]